jgi:hypothetical protein
MQGEFAAVAHPDLEALRGEQQQRDQRGRAAATGTPVDDRDRQLGQRDEGDAQADRLVHPHRGARPVQVDAREHRLQADRDGVQGRNQPKGSKKLHAATVVACLHVARPVISLIDPSGEPPQG